MTFRKIVCTLLLLSIAVSLAACALQPTGGATQPPDSTLPPESTGEALLDNIFTTPATEDETESAMPLTGGSRGTYTHSFQQTDYFNEFGRCDIYEGGEMHIGYSITTTGAWKDFPVGVLLILDGLPQPYKTEEDGEEAYFHTFQPTGGRAVTEMIFTPVTGKQGDTLELCAIFKRNPDYYFRGVVEEGTAAAMDGTCTFTQLEYRATPPQREILPVQDRIADCSITYADLTSADTVGWKPERLQTDCAFSLTTDHQEASSWLFGVTPEEGIHVTAEVFGNPTAELSLILYVGNQPVSVLTENRLLFRNQPGQKAILKVHLDLADFDGEDSFYAVLCVRNRRAPGVFSTSCEFILTPKLFLTDAADYYAALEKYGIE